MTSYYYILSKIIVIRAKHIDNQSLMIILYTTPTNKSIGINHPNQIREQR